MYKHLFNRHTFLNEISHIADKLNTKLNRVLIRIYLQNIFLWYYNF